MQRKSKVALVSVILLVLALVYVGITQLINPFISPIARSLSVESNLLTNGDMEGKYIEVATGWNVPPGWTPFSSGDNPEFGESNLAHPYRVRSGEKAAKWFFMWRVGTAGLFQQVSGLQAGTAIEASVWGHAWSGDWCPDEDGYFRANGQPTSLWVDPPDSSCDIDTGAWDNVTLYIGIDPYGGTDPTSNDIVWTQTKAYDDYEQLSVQTVARSSIVTVFIKSSNLWGFRQNDSYFDDASLVVLAPAPTNTPTSTDTPTPEPYPWPPTRTPRPRVTPNPSALPQSYLPIVLYGHTDAIVVDWIANITGTHAVTVSVGTTISVNVVFTEVSGMAATEMILVINPVVAPMHKYNTGHLMRCDDESTTMTASSIRYECEGEQIAAWGTLMTIGLHATMPGTTRLEPSARWSVFFGEQSGFGFNPDIRSLKVVVVE